VGDTSRIEVDAFPDTAFIGLVKEISNTGQTTGLGTQEEVTNFLVKVSMLEKPNTIRPGMSATVDVMTETQKQVIKVPIQCVTVREPIEPEVTEADSSEESVEKVEDTEESTGESEEKPEEGFEKKERESVSHSGPKKPIRVVFVVREGIVHQVPVKTGISSDTEWEIKEGLEEDEEVVSGSYRVLSKQLKHGDLVKVDNSMKQFGREQE
jgi:HlyD family secretion protein